MSITSRAIALLRVSTEAQADEDRAGLPAQRAECERIAAAHGLEVVAWVSLRGVSGAAVREDPRFVDLLDRLAEPDVGGVIVAAFDRLLRRGRFADYAVLDAFVETGSVLWTSSGRIDPSRPTDGIMSLVYGELGGIELARIRERTMQGKEVLRRQGRHVSGDRALPYGVAYDRETGAWSYRPAEAQVVSEVFRRVVAGERNFSAVARDLGIPRTLVRKILCQPLYKGVWRIAYRYPGRRKTPRAPGDVLEQTVLDPPLVSPATWETAQAALSRPPTPRGTSPLVYVGTATCGRCGGRLSAHHERHRGRWSYRCRRGCFQLMAATVDAAADRAVEEHLAQPGVIAAALGAVLGATRSPEPISAADRGREAKRLAEERERVVLAFERGLRSLTETERRTRELDAAIRRLEAAPAREDTHPDPWELAALLAAPFAEWSVLGTSQKRRILAAGVERLVVERPRRSTARIIEARLRVSPQAPRTEQRRPGVATLVVPCEAEWSASR